MHYLFLFYICSSAFLHLFLFIITLFIIKKGYIVIINIVIIIKKGSGGHNTTLLGDFALEPSENFNLIFLRIEFADSIGFKWM